MPESPQDIALDLAAVARLDAVPGLLRVICETTGMGFGVVARVSDQTWTACAVQDDIAFGLAPGGQLDLHSTLCKEVREAREPVAIDHASQDARYCDHHTPRQYGLESYISVPIVLPSGEYFGNLCAIDPRPAQVANPRIITMFQLFADLIGSQLAADRAKQQQAEALREAITSNELREQFVAVLGHDLRTPLSAINMSAQALLRNRQDELVQKMAGGILSSARRMADLISDVMDLAKGRLGGGFDVELAPVHDLARALAEVAEEVRSVHPARRFDVDLDGLSAVVRCDRARLQQLAANLLANAMHHGDPAAPVTFTAQSGTTTLVLKVRNGGAPIPPDVIAQVFQPFWRSASAKKREGLGLGLFICAEIVKAHAGLIEVQSTAEDGTCFTVTLPLTGPGD